MKDRATVTDILKDLAEGSSLHGIPKIVSSKQRPIKVLWCILFAVAVTVLTMQMYSLFTEFLSHPIKTTVSLKFSPLPFPAITFCNMNPVKLSHVNTYPKLEEIIHAKKSKNPNERNKRQTGTTRELSTLPASIANTSVTSSPGEEELSTDGSKKNYNNDTDFNDYDSYGDEIDEKDFTDHDRNDTENGETDYIDNYSNDDDNDYYETDYWGKYDEYSEYDDADSTYDDFFDYWDDVDFNVYDDYYDSYDDSRMQQVIDSYIREQMSSPKDKWDERRVIFRAKYKNESLQSRIDMGHSLEDMVMSASFARSLQNISKFERATTTEYGNCYTMTSPKYTAMRSGMAHGIKLTLNLEIEEYVKNFASGYGVRVVFHEPGTFPLPAEEGMTLSPGYETSVGLKAIRLRRLGLPYGNCTSGKDFYNKYRLRYSITVCMHLCRIESTIESCGCIPADAPDLNITSWNVSVCSKDDFRCQLTVEVSFDEGKTNDKCKCISPCRETVFMKTLSGRPWPNSDYLEHVLMKDVCRRNITSMKKACSAIENDTFEPGQYKHNFLRLLVYYEDLNFESITQTPLYEPVRFVSDIGGAMGLFLGASLLSFVEVLQLLLELLFFLLRGRRQTGKRSFEQKDAIENAQDPLQGHFKSSRV